MKILTYLQSLILIALLVNSTTINAQTKQNNLLQQLNNNDSERQSIDFQIIKLEFSASDNLSRELVLGFSDQTTDGYDYGYDAQMSNFFSNDLASLLQNDKMVIQAFAEIQTDKQVGLVLNSDANYTYTISIKELDNIGDSQEIYLYDALENVNHNLRDSDYVFTAEAGEDATRFKLNFNSQTSLSVIDNDLKETVIRVDSNNMLYIEGLTETVKHLKIYNILGKIVEAKTTIKAEVLKQGVSLQNSNKGIYILQLQLANGKTLAKKILLN
ncbi:T9SS type A sorting domain-containing protein [Lacinutrix salivirga]